MKAVNTVRAESDWTLDLNGLNRTDRRLAPEFLEAIAERFSFPGVRRDSAEIPFHFKNGMFDVEGHDVRVEVVISRTRGRLEWAASTETGDAFLEILLQTACEFFEVPRTDAVVHARAYVSELNFLAETDLSVADDGCATFLEAAARAISATNGPMRVASLGFSGDPYRGTWLLAIEFKTIRLLRVAKGTPGPSCRRRRTSCSCSVRILDSSSVKLTG